MGKIGRDNKMQFLSNSNFDNVSCDNFSTLQNNTAPTVIDTYTTSKQRNPKSPNSNWLRYSLFILFGLLSLILANIAVVGATSQTNTNYLTDSWTDGLVAQTAGTETWTGLGTKDSPYELSTAKELAQLAVNVNNGTTYENKYLELTTALNLSGKQWTAIGTQEHPFMGNFSGLDNVIYFLTINKPYADNQGLFGFTNFADITMISIYNANLVARNNLGSIVGYALNTNVSNCCNDYIKQNLTNTYDDVIQSIVSQKNFFDTTLTTVSYSAGSGNKYNISNTSSSTSSGNVGGCIGKYELSTSSSYNVTIYNCYNTGSITSTSGNCGGIIGYQHVDCLSGDWMTEYNNTINLYNCVNTGAVYGATYSGGIVGWVDSNGHETTGVDHHANNYDNECLNAGSVNGGTYGAIAGHEFRGSYSYIGLQRDVYNKSVGPSNLLGSYEVNSTSGSVGSYTANCRCTSTSLPSVYSSTAGWTASSWYCSGPTTSVSGGYTYTYYYYPAPRSIWVTSIIATSTSVANTYTIYFNQQSGSGGTSSINVTYGSSVSNIAVPSRTGYTFYGYYTSTSGAGTYLFTSSGVYVYSTYSYTTSITVYAYWVPITYSITYYPNGGSGSTLTQTKTYGVNLTLYTSSTSGYTRTGYTLTSWNTNSSGTGTNYSLGGTYTTNASLTLYAKWTIISYSITYYPNGPSASVITDYKNYGASITIRPSNTYNYAGYNFLSWNTSSSGTGTNYTPGSSYSTNVSLTLYAQWSIITYSIYYYPNGGSGSTLIQSKTYDVNVTLYTSDTSGYTYTGYILSSWNTSSGGTGTTYDVGATYTTNSSLTLYAQWTLITYTINYYLNDGTGTFLGSATKSYNVDLTLMTSVGISRIGYDALGWNSNSEATIPTYSFGGEYTTNASQTFYVVWQLKSYQITTSINLEDAGVVTGDGVYNHFSICTVVANVNEHYEFVQWNENGSPVSTNASYSFEVTGPRTLVAIYKVIDYSVSGISNYNGTANIVGNGIYAYNTFITLNVIDTDSRFNFVCWEVDNVQVSTEKEYSFNVVEDVSPVAVYQFVFTSMDISHASTLFWLSNCVNNGYDFAGVTFYFMRDLDLSNITDNTWTTIGSGSNVFAGIIQGNGYIITNTNSEITLFNSPTGEIFNLLTNGNIIVGATVVSNEILYENPTDRIYEQFENSNHGGR